MRQSLKVGVGVLIGCGALALFVATKVSIYAIPPIDTDSFSIVPSETSKFRGVILIASRQEAGRLLDSPMAVCVREGQEGSRSCYETELAKLLEDEWVYLKVPFNKELYKKIVRAAFAERNAQLDARVKESLEAVDRAIADWERANEELKGGSAPLLQAPSVRRTGKPPIVTLDEYDQLKEGMIFGEVYAVVGDLGEEKSSTHLAGVESQAIQWTNPDGSNMLVLFQNNQLVSKSQSGLH
jgi:hypothetical protein